MLPHLFQPQEPDSHVTIDVPLKDGGFGSTRRTDKWWVEPILVFLGYMAFIVYATWAALAGQQLFVHDAVRRR